MSKRVLALFSILVLLASLALLASNGSPLRAQAKSGASSTGTSYDLVVYGGTAGGVITAVSAAREGLAVALLEPGRHLGGMVSGGLGWTDYGRKEVIGGYSLEFFERVGKKYGQADRVALRAARRRGGLPGSGEGGRGPRVPRPPPARKERRRRSPALA